MTEDSNSTQQPEQQPAPGTPLVTENVKASGSYQMPADYYSQPPQQRAAGNPGCPRWIPIGCGLGGCLIIVLLFVGALMLTRGAGSGFSLWFVNRVEIELRGMMTAEVTQQQRAAYDREFALLRDGIKSERVKFLQLGEWLESTRTIMNDQKVTPQEVDSLLETTRKINAGGKSKATTEIYSGASVAHVQL